MHNTFMCTHKYMYTCNAHQHTRTHTGTHLHTCLYIHTHTNAHIDTHIHLQTCKYTCVHTCSYKYINTYTSIHTQRGGFINIHTFTLTHVCTHMGTHKPYLKLKPGPPGQRVLPLGYKPALQDPECASLTCPTPSPPTTGEGRRVGNPGPSDSKTS